MRTIAALIFLLLICLAPASLTPARAQEPHFSDVPPWHWAYDTVQDLAAKGIIQGFPAYDRDMAGNAVRQAYEAFAHASHPAAQSWAERFLTNLPAAWPQPLRQAPRFRYELSNMRVRVSEARASVSLTAVVRFQDGRATRRALAVDVLRDAQGIWRAEYGSLAAGQPEIFR